MLHQIVSKSQSPLLNQSYQKTVLPNGIRVVTEEIPYVRSISVGVWINVGSRDEDENTNGISHFLEHMVFKGTKNYGMQRIASSLESVGGYLNAFTTKEHTCFYARILDEHLLNAMDVLSDLVQYPLFNKRELEKEKTVVLEEIKNIEDDPDDLIHDYFDKSLYQKHPLSFPIIGTEKNVSSFTKEDLEKYFSSHYVPSRIVVAAAGNLKHEALVKLVEKYFKGKTKIKGERPARSSPRVPHSSTKTFDKPITQAHICVGTLGYGVKNKQRYPLLILNTVLGEGMSSRLFQNIREKYGFAYSVYSFANLMSDTGNFGVYLGTDKNHIDHSVGLICKELAKLAKNPVSTVEFKRARAQVKGSMMLGLENTSSRMMRLGTGELFYGSFTPIDEILRKLNEVSIEEIHSVAKQLLKEERYSTVIFKPAEKNVSQ
jgi:predicted Zn-dependent peptidase